MALLRLPALGPRASTVPGANATLSARIDLTEAVARFRIRPDGGAQPFRAGQYFALGLDVDGRLLQRPYSTASSPDARDELEFLVHLVPGGMLTPRLWALRPGERLHLGRPKGLFTLGPGDDRAHLFVSTGTGLAPFISMLHELTSRARPPRAVVVHGAAHQQELAYRSWLEDLAAETSSQLHYVPAISRPRAPENAGWHGPVGRMDTVLPAVWERLGLDPNDTVAYLCGNPGMIETGVQLLAAQGLEHDAIRHEQYWTAGAAAPAA
jgi:ferredoxin--NADP+ reductase